MIPDHVSTRPAFYIPSASFCIASENTRTGMTGFRSRSRGRPRSWTCHRQAAAPSRAPAGGPARKFRAVGSRDEPPHRFIYFLYSLRSQIFAMVSKSRSLWRSVALCSTAICATRRSTVFLTVAPFFLHFRYKSAAAM